jgi:hypothetical protein
MTMIGHGDEAKVMDLLAPLRRLEPVPFVVKEGAERRLWRRPILVGVVAVVGLVLAGVAIADGFGAFDGIGAAQRPQTAADRLEFKDPACTSGDKAAAASPFCHLIPESARMIRTLTNGRRLWVVTDTDGDLCIILQGPATDSWSAGGCGAVLNASQPTTLASFAEGPGIPPVTFGVALDGVVAVSFIANDRTVTVPVTDNVWAYEGHNSARDSLTIHYANGTTSVLHPDR